MSTNSHGSFAPLLDPLSPTPSRTRSSSGSSIGSSRQHGSYQDSYRKPFAGGPGNRSSGATTLSQSTVSEKYRGIMDSSSTIQYADGFEDDDDLHNPDPKRDMKADKGGTVFTMRGIENVGCLALLATGLLMLFAGYPIFDAVTKNDPAVTGSFNLGGVNGSGQVPQMIVNFGLIDKDTPASAYTWKSLRTGEDWELIFSDEFEQEGRSFWPGDDPYWTASDLHYWSTNNLEWYAPRRVTTANGSLVITLDNTPSHGLDYEGGLVSTWNQFCFRGGHIDVSLRLPGRPDVWGLWPAVWTLGNLGRAAYGGTLDGMWPYTYDSCDVGTLANQTLNGLPAIATTSGQTGEPFNGALSFLPGQRLSACTCPNDPHHPGPKRADGTWVGRSAPEIDVIEAQVSSGANPIGHVSQSSQWAPFNPEYFWLNTSANLKIEDHDVSELNTYFGGVYQQATSVVSTTNQRCYETTKAGTPGCFSTYGTEYMPGNDGYIIWVNDGKNAWTFEGAGMGANAQAQVGPRPVPYEPMYLIINLGISPNFGAIDFEGLRPLWPVHMHVDYIRVYQPPGQKNIGCNPPDMPTAAYIAKYEHAYNDPNVTTFEQMTTDPKPLNRLIDTCT